MDADTVIKLLQAATPPAAIVAALIGGAAALSVGQGNRAAKAGELLLPATAQVLDDAQRQLDRAVDVYRKLLLLDSTVHGDRYWDEILDVLRKRGEAVKYQQFRQIRDRIDVVCGYDTYVRRAFDQSKDVYRRHEKARIDLKNASTVEQRELIAEQYLELLYRAERFARLSQEHLRLLALGQLGGPTDLGRLGRIGRIIRRFCRIRPWSNFDANRHRVAGQMRNFRSNITNPFGLRDDTLLVQRDLYPEPAGPLKH